MYKVGFYILVFIVAILIYDDLKIREKVKNFENQEELIIAKFLLKDFNPKFTDEEIEEIKRKYQKGVIK